MTDVYATTPSPVGELLLTGRPVGGRVALTGLYLPGHRGGAAPTPQGRRDGDALAPAREQLAAYFAGDRTDFDLPLAPVGTPFQLRVWAALRTIPYAGTASYGALARTLGASARAVGSANGHNPISIVVPCHRVVGADGSLTGYAGGLAAKRTLLDLEATVAGRLTLLPGR